MSYFTEVFRALDCDNKGYILFDDFKNEMQKYLQNDDQSWATNVEQEKGLKNFLNLILQSNEKKIYFNDFIEAINKLNLTNEIISGSSDDNGRDSIHYPIFNNNDSSPFINDGDSYSTGDSGLDYESKFGHEYTNIGKQNRKKIKAVQNIDLFHGGETLKRRFSQNEPSTNLVFEENQICQKSFNNLPQTDLKSSYRCERRQRNYASSDFITCASNRVNRNSQCDGDDETKSYHCWTPCTGSVTDLYYHDSMTDIKKKLDNLEQSMDNLQTVTLESKHSKKKWQDENKYLKSQLNNLEDAMKQQKLKFERNLNIEIEAARKNMNKLEQTRLEDIDILNQRLKTKDVELDNLRKELNISLRECESLKYDKLRSEDKLGDLQQQMNFIEDDMRRLKDFHSRELELLTRERNRLLSVVKGTETNPNFQTSTLLTPQSSQQLQNENSKLRLENQELKSKLENCEEEFLSFSIQQGQTILNSVAADNSWMLEIDGYNKQEIIEMLVKEKDGNFRLREYVSRILTRIIERDPSLLEIP